MKRLTYCHLSSNPLRNNVLQVPSSMIGKIANSMIGKIANSVTGMNVSSEERIITNQERRDRQTEKSSSRKKTIDDEWYNVEA